MNDILRKGQTGEATHNTGHFGSKTQSDPTIPALRGPLPERTVIAADLGADDVVLGINGGRVAVLKAETSGGNTVVTTEFGRLLFDADQELVLAATDEKRVEFTDTTLDEYTADRAIGIIREKLGYTGTMWTRADVETIVDEMVEEGNLTAPDHETIWEKVSWSSAWQDLGGATEGEWDQIRDAISQAADPRPEPMDNPIIAAFVRGSDSPEAWISNFHSRAAELGDDDQQREAYAYIRFLSS